MSQGTFPGFGPGIAGRLGAFASNPLLIQIFVWQVLQQITAAILTPEMSGIQQEAYQLNPSTPLSPAEAVNAAIRGYLSAADAAHEARNTGYDERRFKLLLDSAGNPPGVGELLELWRREVIPEAGAGADSISYEQGVREGQTKNKWIDPLKALKTQLPAPGQALAALLEGQTDETTARKLYEQWGGDPRYFDLLFNTEGSAPTPLEAAMMARRGIIPWEGQGAGIVSFKQAFLEGPWRNKWETAYREAAQYIPPPRAVTAMLRNGAITEAQAVKFYSWAGANPEVTAALIADAHHQRAAATHQLVKGEILALYADGGFTEAETLTELGHLGYDPATAALEVKAVDLRADKALITSAISRIRSLFIGHRIDEQGALAGLDNLKVTPAHRDRLMQVWRLERAESVKVLTAAEVTHLVKLGAMEEAEGLARLIQEGYTPDDAWLRLAAGLGGKPDTPRPA